MPLDSRVGQFAKACVYAKRKHVVRPEAERRFLKPHQASQEEPGANQQRRGEGELS